MRIKFTSLFRLLAQFAREPLSSEPRVSIARSYALRETINSTFNQVRALADALWFEFGSSRQQDLALRSRILGWQQPLRVLFVTRVPLLKYRFQLPGFELPEQVRLAQQEFDESLARVLDGMADQLEGKARQGMENLEASLARLEEIANTGGPAEAQGVLASHMQTFLTLSRRIESLVVSLDRELLAQSYC